MSSSIHLANAKGRDATVGLVPIKAASGPKLGLPGQKLYFRRYLAATEGGTHQALTKKFGGDYGQVKDTGSFVSAVKNAVAAMVVAIPEITI
jgi:hypothetical protein